MRHCAFIDSVNAVIVDLDTTAGDKELAWLNVLQPCDELLPDLWCMERPAAQNYSSPDSNSLGHQQNNDSDWVRKPFRNEELLAAVRESARESCRHRESR